MRLDALENTENMIETLNQYIQVFSHDGTINSKCFDLILVENSDGELDISDVIENINTWAEAFDDDISIDKFSSIETQCFFIGRAFHLIQQSQAAALYVRNEDGELSEIAVMDIEDTDGGFIDLDAYVTVTAKEDTDGGFIDLDAYVTVTAKNEIATVVKVGALLDFKSGLPFGSI